MNPYCKNGDNGVLYWGKRKMAMKWVSISSPRHYHGRIDITIPYVVFTGDPFKARILDTVRQKLNSLGLPTTLPKSNYIIADWLEFGFAVRQGFKSVVIYHIETDDYEAYKKYLYWRRNGV